MESFNLICVTELANTAEYSRLADGDVSRFSPRGKSLGARSEERGHMVVFARY